MSLRQCTKQRPRPRYKPLTSLSPSLASCIPNEVFDSIISYIGDVTFNGHGRGHEDKQNHENGYQLRLSTSVPLARIGLVSRTWLHLSRRYLFQVIRITEKNVEKLEELSSSPHWSMPSYVVGVQFHSPLIYPQIELQPFATPEVLRQDIVPVTYSSVPGIDMLHSFLSSIRLLSLDLDAHCVWRTTENHLSFSFASLPIPKLQYLEHLTLHSMKFECMSEFTHILEALPSIRHLTLQLVYWYGLSEDELMPPPNPVLVRNLETLRMRSWSTKSFVDWLMSARKVLELKELDLGVAEGDVCEKVCRAMDGSRLRTLVIHKFANQYDVAKFTNLQSINISIRSPDECEPALSVLERLTTSQLTTIQFSIYTRFFLTSNPLNHFFDSFDWEELRAVLGGSSFRWLVRMEFSFTVGYRKAKGKLREKLPEWHEKGLVYVSEACME